MKSMTFVLYYRVNEGIMVSEEMILKHTGEKFQESIDVIVRNIDLFPEGVKVDFEFRDLNGNSELKSLTENERYDVTPLCTLHLPINPLRGKSQKHPLRRSKENKVCLKFYAPKTVEFGERKMYD